MKRKAAFMRRVAGVALSVMIFGCGREIPENPEDPAVHMAEIPVVGVDWRLSELHGEALVPVGGSEGLSLRLDAGSSEAQVFSGVNRFQGEYRATETGGLTLGHLSCTRQVGQPAAMAREEAFLSALRETDGWRIEQGDLILLSRGLPIARLQSALVP